MKKIANFLSLIALVLTLAVTFAFSSKEVKFAAIPYSVVGETTNSYILSEQLTNENLGQHYQCNISDANPCAVIAPDGTTAITSFPAKVSKAVINASWTRVQENRIFVDVYTPALGDTD